jgi:hypothetical protein
MTMSHVGRLPTDFEPCDILESDDFPLSVGFQDDISILVRPEEVSEEHDPAGRINSLARIKRAARCQCFQHVFPGEVAGAQTVDIQPKSDLPAATPWSPILGILAKDDLVGCTQSGPEQAETDCRNGHTEHEVSEPEAKVWPSHHGCFHPTWSGFRLDGKVL